MSDITREQVRGALTYLSADMPRNDWVRIGMSIKSQFPGDDGFSVFDEWSARGEGYKHATTAAQWRSFKTNGGITIGTLVKMAKDNGYVMDSGIYTATSTVEQKSAQEIADERAAEQAAKEIGWRETSVRAEEAWGRYRDIGAGERTGYLERKDVDGYGVRVTNDGKVVVPLRDVDGKLWSLQYIAAAKPEDGSTDKLFMKDGRKAGLYHMMGEARDGQAVLLAEGYATAASLHAATGKPVAVAFDAGNLGKVAVNLRGRFPNSPMLVCGDDDLKTLARTGRNDGREKAILAAHAVGGVAVFPEGLPEGGSDFNDLHKHLGNLDKVRQLVDQGLQSLLAKIETTKTAPVEQANIIGNGAAPEVDATEQSKTAQEQTAAPSEPPKSVQPSPEANTANDVVGDFKTPMLAALQEAYSKLGDQYLRADNKFYFRDDQKTVAFEDKRNSLFTTHSKPDVIRSMVELAKAKGWETLHLKGTEDFMREAWLEAQLLGLKVSGYTPQPLDHARLNERLELAALDKGVPVGVNVMSAAPVLAPEVDAKPMTAEQQGEALAQVREQRQKETKVMQELRQELAKDGATPEEAALALDAVKSMLVTDRAYVGKVLDHGSAPYLFKKDERMNYFVTIEHSDKSKQDVWGVDLRRAIGDGGVKMGDAVFVAYQGSRPVTVEVYDRDAAGKIVGSHEETTNRNTWLAERISVLREDAKHGVDHNHTAKLPVTTQDAPNVPYTAGTEAISVMHAALSIRGIPTEVIHSSLTSAQDAIVSNPLRGGAVSVKLVDQGGVEHISAPVTPYAAPASQAMPSSSVAAPTPNPNIGM
jgi:phage/plasmid primase-like uncharacterized protein